MLHQVGAGTLGPVYRAHDAGEGRLVAIKAFTLDLVPERALELATTLNALVARNLSHPSIAAPLAAGLEGSTPWVAQEYVPAESLDVALREYGPPPPGEALELITNLAGALDFAAAAGVLHGALHPRDVLVAPDDTRVVDLGIAAALEQHGIRPPVRRPYTAPEQVAGGSVTRAGDIFALAAIAWEVLTGHRLAGPGAIAADMLPPFGGIDRDALAAAFSRATDDDPAARPSSALAFVAALRAAITDLAALEAGVPHPAVPPRTAVPPDRSDSEAVAREPIEPPTEEPPSSGGSLHDGSRFPSEIEWTADDSLAGTGSVPVLPTPTGPAGRDEHDDFALYPTPVPVEPSPWDRGSMPGAEDEHELVAHAGPPRHEPVRARPARKGPSWPLLAVLLVIGMTLGFGGAYVFFGKPAGQSGAATQTSGAQSAAAPAPVPSAPSASAAGTPAHAPTSSSQAPREFTDNTVPEPPAITSAPVDESAPPARQSAQTAAREPSPREHTAAPRKAQSTRRPEPARPARGQLTVRSRPSGAAVEVNGRRRGDTPVTIDDLPFGGYQLTITRDGYAREQRRVTLTTGRSSATVDVPMRRSRTAADDADSTPPPSARTASGEFVGAVLVESRPSGARVFIDGKFVGNTPLSVAEVPVGSHVVRIDMTGYNRWSSAVRVVAGERVRVAASLEEEVVR